MGDFLNSFFLFGFGGGKDLTKWNKRQRCEKISNNKIKNFKQDLKA